MLVYDIELGHAFLPKRPAMNELLVKKNHERGAEEVRIAEIGVQES